MRREEKRRKEKRGGEGRGGEGIIIVVLNRGFVIVVLDQEPEM